MPRAMPQDETANADEIGLKYFEGKKQGRTYVSKRIVNKYDDGSEKHIRIVSKVVDGQEEWSEAQLKGETVLRITPGGRQEIVAKVYEDSRGVFGLTIQRFRRSILGNRPMNEHFSFRSDEYKTLKEFLDSIPYLVIPTDGKSRVEDSKLKEDIERVRTFLSENPDLDMLIEMAQQKITKADVVTIAYRRQQIEIFEKLLTDLSYFQQMKTEWKKKRDEDVWQHFFEKNVWIFGYGLNYVFNAPLEGKKLEQIVQGADVAQSGKRVDGLLKTRGIINSVCLVEIKLPTTGLLKPLKNSYRPDCWQVSDELNGAIAQIQKTVQKTVENVGTKLETYRDNGDPSGETVFCYEPKSYLIVGNLSEFDTDAGVNKEKYSSFELYRKNMLNPEIITFDELYERARFIVHNNEENRIQSDDDAAEEAIPEYQEEINELQPVTTPVMAYGDEIKVEDLPF